MSNATVWYGRVEGRLEHGMRLVEFQRNHEAICLRVGRWLVVVSHHVTKEPHRGEWLTKRAHRFKQDN